MDVLDYLGILTDGKKIADENTKFRLTVVDPVSDGDADYKGRKVRKVTEFSVHLYYGTVLYYEGHTDEELPGITIPEKALPLILDTSNDTIFEAADTKIPEVLKKIRNAVVNIQEKAYFPMVEANTTEL